MAEEHDDQGYIPVGTDRYVVEVIAERFKAGTINENVTSDMMSELLGDFTVFRTDVINELD